ncbi:MAG: U32 family peptidase, partial [Oscillospiraceae bacterium]|nr:U32 family peptidase [Oscillospiraceae bacterium]
MELLAPAGSWEAMTAAVQNGADAVYLGCGAWNARRAAKNFTEEELPEAVRYCHLRGVRVYLTLNTLLSDRELPQAAAVLRRASRCGVDAVIVQDWGLAALARQTVPDLPLHGSTQMTIHTLAGVEAAAALGMRCVVLSRELDRENIRYICENSPVPIEIFGHGALCMCWSGQCAMSAFIGGRSGNRGLCAQPCRLPYRIDGGKTGHPLSLKDSCLAQHIPELLDMGVSILKLEGRMKRPEYVAVVTRIYAALIREKRAPNPEEMRQLTDAFSR